MIGKLSTSARSSEDRRISLFKFKLAVQDAYLDDPGGSPNVVKELSLVIAVQATANRRVVSFADV